MGWGLESGLQERAVSCCHVWLTAVSGSWPPVAGGQAGRGALAQGTLLWAAFTLAVSVQGIVLVSHLWSCVFRLASTKSCPHTWDKNPNLKFHHAVYFMCCIKPTSVLLQNGLGFFSVVMCNFCCIPWKEYLKENMYKVLCVKAKKRLSFLFGAFVLEDVGGIHLSVLCCWCSYTTPWCHTPSSNLASPEQCLRLCKVTHSRCSAQALRSPWWHWGSGQSSWGLPLWRRGFWKGPAPCVLLKIHQGQLFTAPEHLCYSW